MRCRLVGWRARLSCVVHHRRLSYRSSSGRLAERRRFERQQGMMCHQCRQERTALLRSYTPTPKAIGRNFPRVVPLLAQLSSARGSSPMYLSAGLVCWEEQSRAWNTRLCHQSSLYLVIELAVAGQSPVIHQTSPYCSCFSPSVSWPEDTNCLSRRGGRVERVVGQYVLSYDFGGRFDISFGKVVSR